MTSTQIVGQFKGVGVIPEMGYDTAFVGGSGVQQTPSQLFVAGKCHLHTINICSAATAGVITAWKLTSTTTSVQIADIKPTTTGSYLFNHTNGFGFIVAVKDVGECSVSFRVE